MTDTKPILFSGPMIKALLDGRKTQTRRVLKSGTDKPKYQIGDTLWVRENWSGNYYFEHCPPSSREDMSTPDGYVLRGDIWYWADGSPEFGDWEKPRPSIFMPRWASRITLTVTAVRVQRIQAISDSDALAEGVEMAVRPRAGQDIDIDGEYWPDGPRRMFRELWNSINAKRGFGWCDNPYVAAYTFTVALRNIDTDKPDA